MEGEQQALVNETQLEACQRRYNEAGRDLDDARNAVDQWKYRHRNHDPSDPTLLQLEQKVNDADRRLQNAHLRLQEARKVSEAWIDTGTTFILYIYVWNVLMTNTCRSAFEVICKLVGLAGYAFQFLHESKEGELDVYLLVARIFTIGGFIIAIFHAILKHYGYSFSRFYRCICGCTRSRSNRQ